MKRFSKAWKKSKKPIKKRKYKRNAEYHLKSSFMSVNLSKELRAKYKTRNISIRKDDTVKVLRGSFKGKTGKVTGVDRKNYKIYVEGVDRNKQDGAKVLLAIDPSNCQAIDLNLNDKYRTEKLRGLSKNG